MKKRELNSIKVAISHFKTAYKARGYYCPSDVQASALRNLLVETSALIGKMSSNRLEKLLESMDNAKRNQVYGFDFTEKQIEAIEKAIAKVE